MALVLDLSARLLPHTAQREANPPSPDVWQSHVRLLERSNSKWQPVRRITRQDFWTSPEVMAEHLTTLEGALNACKVKAAGKGVSQMLAIPSFEPSGFDIDIAVEGGSIMASFGGLDQDFQTVAGAFVWVQRALSNAYHLRIGMVGDLPCEWALEPVAKTVGLQEVLASGTVISSGRGKTYVYRQNQRFAE